MKGKPELSEVLRESLSSSAEKLPVPDWHGHLLDESIERLKSHPNDGNSWTTVKARLHKDT